MSHITPITRDESFNIDTLKRMCADNGWVFAEGQQTYIWYGRFVGDSPLPAGVNVEDLGKCHHAIQIPGAEYEIGVVCKDGQVQLLYDFWKWGGLLDALGENAWKLNMAYDVSKARMAAEALGQTWQMEGLNYDDVVKAGGNAVGWQKMTVEVSGW